MNPARLHLIMMGWVLGVCMGLAMPSVAQYNRVPANTNPGYNQSNLQQNTPNFQGNPQNAFNNPDQQNLRRIRSSRSRSDSSTSDNTSMADPNSQRGSLSGRNQQNPSRVGGTSNTQSPGNQPANAMRTPANITPINPNLPPPEPGGLSPGQGVSPLGPSGGYTRNVIHRTVTEEPIRQNATFYLNPSSAFAILNQPITVDVVLSNKKKVKYDRLAFLVQFDPQDLLLTTGQKEEGNWQKAASLSIPSSIDPMSSVTYEKKGGFLAVDTVFQITQNIVDSNRGLILFDASVRNQEPISTEGKVIPLTFVPLREITTKISFLFVDPDRNDASQGPITRLSLDELDQLGTSFSQADGVSNLDLPIFATFEQAQRQPVISKAGEPSENSDEEGSDIQLSLVPRKVEVNVGEIVNVDIVLQNPDKKAFDTVYLLIAYNPRFFEPVDGDDYSNGINIADKEYGENFGLDFPILNVVDKQKGIIDYRKKAMRRPVRSQGILATIQLQAIRPTKKSTFRLFLNDTGQEPTTGLFYRYKDRLGDDSDPFDGVTTCSIGVRATTAYLKKLSEEGE